MQLLKILKPFLNNKRISYVLTQKCPLSTTPPTTCWFQKKFRRKISSVEKENNFKRLDRVPENYQLVYYAPLESYVVWPIHLSTITASLVTLAGIYQYVYNLPIVETTQHTLVLEKDDIYYFAAGFIAINAAIRWVISKFPLRIYKNAENYLAIYKEQLPGLQSQHPFKRGEVKKVNYMFNPWNNATYKLASYTSLLLPDYFKTPSEFHQMFVSEEDKY
uniref:Uncharacterized protein n=1 Tax=Glossina brevipalpis TaxID=37001 RepID=A0A1A9WK29_9MUSC